MPCLFGHPHPAFLDEEQLAASKQMAMSSNADIFFVCSIIIRLQNKLFSQTNIVV